MLENEQPPVDKAILDRDALKRAGLGRTVEDLLRPAWEHEDVLTLPQRQEIMPEKRRRNRVVITGLGAITPLGLTVKDLWDGLLAGRSGIRKITGFDASAYPCQIGGEVRGFEPGDFLPVKEARRLSRHAQFAVAATRLALEDAALEPPFDRPERVGVVLGTGVGGLPEAADGYKVMVEKGGMRLSPFFGATIIPNMAAFHLAHTFGARGHNLTVSTACATGTQAVGEAAEVVRRGAADVVIACGTEAILCEAGLAAFCVMRALSTRNDEPERASRPFDAQRDGFVLGEGCGVLILENLQHALRREAVIYAEVLGYAANSDGYHMAVPEPEGQGAIQAMRAALASADLDPGQVDYINAHGSATPANDAMETLAIKRVFGHDAYRIPISATKSMIGHLMGGAGAVEAIACALSLYHGRIHPTINYETPDPACDLDYVPNQGREIPLEIALSNSFGLGGQNACLVLGRYHGRLDDWQS